MDLKLTSEQITDIIGKAQKSSALAQLTPQITISDSRDKVLPYLDNEEPGRFHLPSQEQKTVAGDSVAPLEIDMYPVYKVLQFSDKDAANEATLTDALKNRLPLALAEAIDQGGFGTLKSGIPDKNWSSFSTLPAGTALSGKLSSYDDALSALNSKGFNETGWLLDTSVKADLRAAFRAENNGLSYVANGIQDGFNLEGIPSYFRTLNVADAGHVGVVGDFTQARIAVSGNIQLTMVDGSTSYTMMMADKVTIKAMFFVGFRFATPDAFVALDPAPKA